MGKISDPLLLEILRRGEILPDGVDIPQELQAIQTETPTTEPAPEQMAPNQVDRLIDLLSR
jgi:hypothetical protein